VTRQESACREYAVERGLTIVATESDNDISAFRGRRRPGWESLLSRVEKGEIDGILVWHTDRLYRRMADLVTLVQTVKERKIQIYSVKAGDVDLSTANGILNAEIMGAVAGHEVRHKSERQIAKAKELAQSGAWSGNRPPLGYRRHPTDKHALVIHEAEADMLRQARRRILAGHGVTDTTRWAKELLEGSDTLRKTLTPTNFRNIMLSPTIAGYRVHVPQAERDDWDRRRSEGRSLPTDYTYGPQHKFPGKWDAIFTEEEWQSISAFLTKPDRVNPGRAPKSLLSGVLTCHLCGSVLGYSKTAGANPAYKCSNDSLNCKGVGISAAPIEDYLTGIAGALIANSPFTVGEPTVKSAPDLDEMDKLQARETRLLDLYEGGVISKNVLQERLDVVRARIFQIQSERDQVLDLAARNAEIHDSMQRWTTLDTAERRAVLKWLFIKVTILPTQKIWGRNFQPLRVVPWYRGGQEPSVEGPLEELRLAEDAQIEKVAERKRVEAARREERLGKGGLK